MNTGLPSASAPTARSIGQPKVPGEADGPVDASRVGELDVAEERAAALALVLGQAFSGDKSTAHATLKPNAAASAPVPGFWLKDLTNRISLISPP